MLALPDVPAVEEVVEEPGAARVGQELGAVADEAAGGIRYSSRTRPVPWFTILAICAAARADLLRDRADELLGDVDDEVLHRLERLAVLGRA